MTETGDAATKRLGNSKPDALAAVARLYAPSWTNVLNAWIERLPGPSLAAYIVGMALGVALSALQIPPESDATPWGGALYYGALPAAALFLINHLDRTAREAFRSLRPLLDLDAPQRDEIETCLTVVPARPALVLTLIAIVLGPAVYVADPVGSGIVGLSPELLALRFAWESLISSIFFVLIYHTFRQLRLVDQIHKKISRIDLFDQGPLYGFSRVTSQTAIGLIVLLVPGLLLIPEGAGAGFIIVSLAWYALTAVIAAAAFVFPLRGIHDLIAAEKRRMQADLGRRITLSLMAIQAAVDSEDGPAIEARNRALSTLVAAREVVNRVPTWPWSSGSITSFATALVLPIVLFLIQRYLGGFLAT